MVLVQIHTLINIKTAAAKKGAPENLTGAFGLVNQAKRLVINSGPTIVVALIRLVSAPCNSPCSF